MTTHLDAANDYAEATFGGIPQDTLQAFSAAAKALADTLPTGSWPLVDGYLAEPVPGDPVHQAYYWSIVLRELRGGVHTEAVIAAGLSGAEACQLDHAGSYFALHGYGDEDRAEETEELVATRLAVEVETSNRMAALLEVLDDAQRAALADGAIALHEAVASPVAAASAAPSRGLQLTVPDHGPSTELAGPPARIRLDRSNTAGRNPDGWTSWPTSAAPLPRIDLPGHGSSTTGSDPSSYDTVAEDVFADLPQPTGAVGFSAGAEILLRIAAAHPGCFDRLVLLGVGDNVFEPSDPARLAAALEGDAEPEDIQARLFYRMAVSSGNDPASLAAFLRRRREPLRDEQLSVVTCPVLVVLGDRDMTTTADRLVAALPSSTLASVPGVDHSPLPPTSGSSTPP